MYVPHRQRADYSAQKKANIDIASPLVSQTAIMTGRFANFAGILPLCFTNEPFSKMARMVTYVRFVPFPC